MNPDETKALRDTCRNCKEHYSNHLTVVSADHGRIIYICLSSVFIGGGTDG